MVLLRFAPSPTGAIHLGGLRTALYNYLYARKLGGRWILRIEDTDATRAVPGAVEGIREALDWAGLEYDYGPGKQGPHAPYYQSGHAYRCFCSPDNLATKREKLARSGSSSTYDKACLNLTEEEVARRMRAGEKSIVRLNDGRLPTRPSPSDLIFKHLRDAHASLPTDPVLLKSDLFPTYHLASVVDDHEMGITHVLRGEASNEWLPSLPLHLDLYAALKLEPPQFAHLPLLLNPDGSKMSKRKGDVQVMDYKRRGWEPAAILNWLALAGWGAAHDSASEVNSSPKKQPPDSTTVLTLDEMVREFDLTQLTHRRSILDPVKLEYLNKHHLMQTITTSEGLTELAERVHTHVKEAYPHSPHTSVEYIKDVIAVMQSRLLCLTDLPAQGSYMFVDPDYSTDEARRMQKAFPPEVYDKVLLDLKDVLANTDDQWSEPALSTIVHDRMRNSGLKPKQYMTILRHVLTASTAGPGVVSVMHVLGRERTLERLHKARSTLASAST
ncbi:glutamyl-tRNA synthetase [Fomitopsis serialis]|uniref:glutamyl-tRNA synthetase n=1 Tax=Fomitopsis serialis TaxID=139415 RepID=UPI002008BF7B|nr:glutamyl-tRNA synthetase [Neoantrodia serialis]KAH9920330.1 glutamyl-tRNA synthetase [Neoantrodia serialis]